MGFFNKFLGEPQPKKTTVIKKVELSDDLKQLGVSATLEVNSNAINNEISILGKQATKYKRAKEWDKAIDCLIRAKKLRKKTSIDYVFSAILRLPKYYMYAGRYEEAIAECKEIVAKHSADKKEKYKHTKLSDVDFRYLGETYQTMATISHKANNQEDCIIYAMKALHYQSICWKIADYPVQPNEQDLQADVSDLLCCDGEIDKDKIIALWVKTLLE